MFVQAPIMVVYVCSALSYLINPSSISFVGVLGLLFPVFLGLQLLFTGYWLFRGKRFAIASTLILLVGWGHFAALMQFGGSDVQDKSDLRVMSFNIHSWRNFENGETEQTRSEIAAFINEMQPDLMFLQEDIKVNEWSALPFKYHEHSYSQTKSPLGYSFFSNYPIQQTEYVRFTERRGHYTGFFWADINVDGKTIRAVNVHLVNTSLAPEKYQSLSGQDQAELTSEQLEKEGLDIYRRLTASYRIRGAQALELAAFVEDSPYPVILCGDFNDTPTSFSYHQISSVLTDAFVENGTGTGDSFNKIPMMPLRIDYIFASEEFTNVAFSTYNKMWSDHKPVIADFTLN